MAQLDILGHIKDGYTMEFLVWEFHLPVIHIAGHEFAVTRHMVMMVIASLLLMLITIPAARRKDKVPKGMRNLLEQMLVFIRDDIARPQMGDKAIHFVPFLATMFFFILFCNLLGLVPFGATATGNISVTAGLALVSFFTIHISGIRQHGLVHYAKNIVPPVPMFLYPLMLVVEILSHLTKPFALAVRLFANMMGGHIVLLVILSFIFTFKHLGVASISVVGVVAMSLLELLVVFIQAFIFTFLSAAFIGAALAEEH